MELPVSSRAAVVSRARAVLGEARPAPRVWADLTVTEKMKIGTLDPELAAILQDRMPPALELSVLSGKLPDVAPAVVTREQQRAEAVAAWSEAHPPIDPAESAQRLQQRVADNRAAVDASIWESKLLANRVLAQQAAAQ
jgi:hypothetical protein